MNLFNLTLSVHCLFGVVTFLRSCNGTQCSAPIWDGNLPRKRALARTTQEKTTTKNTYTIALGQETMTVPLTARAREANLRQDGHGETWYACADVPVMVRAQCALPSYPACHASTTRFRSGAGPRRLLGHVQRTTLRGKRSTRKSSGEHSGGSQQGQATTKMDLPTPEYGREGIARRDSPVKPPPNPASYRFACKRRDKFASHHH